MNEADACKVKIHPAYVFEVSYSVTMSSNKTPKALNDPLCRKTIKIPENRISMDSNSFLTMLAAMICFYTESEQERCVGKGFTSISITVTTELIGMIG